MHISKVRLTNFKRAGVREHELQPLTMIVGPNDSGKSSIVDAIKLALLGYIPGSPAPKTNEGIHTYSAGPTMGVSIEVGGHVVSLATEETRKSIKKSRTGEDKVVVPDVLLDSRTYFNMGPSDRVRYVVGLTDMAALGLTRQTLTFALTGLANTGALEPDVRPVVVAIAQEMKAETTDEALTPWMERWEQTLRKRTTEMAGKARQLRDGVKATMATAPAPANPRCEAELKVAQEKAAALMAEIGQADQMGQTKEQIGHVLQTAMSVASQLEGLLKTRGDLVSKLALENLSRSVPPDLSGARAAVVAAEEALVVRRDEWHGINADLARALAHRKFISESKCPTCGRANTPSEGEINDAQAEVNRMKAELEASVQLGLKANSALAEARAALDKVQAAAEAVHERERTIRQLESELKNIDEQIKAANEWASQVPQLQKQHDAIPLFDLTAKRHELSVIDLQAKGLREQTRALANYRAAQASCQRMADDATKVERELDGTKAAHKECQRVLEESLGKAFESILAKANALLSGIGVFANRLSFKDGDVGYDEGGRRVTWATFGGAKSVLLFAGLGLAFAVQSPFKLVIVDEMGRLDDQTASELMTRVDELIQDNQIDQFIGIDVKQRYGLPEENLILL